MRVPGVGAPRQVIKAAMAALETEELTLEAISPVIVSAPLGPSLRRYANAAVLVSTELAPPDLLVLLQRIERAFGRRKRGQKWRSRPLDCDIVMWSGGMWTSAALTIPHLAFRSRPFVLGPAAAIARSWREPVTGLGLRHLDARLTRPRPLRR